MALEPDVVRVRTPQAIPYVYAIAYAVAPLVERGIITDAEGQWLVAHTYRMSLVRGAWE